MTDFSDTRPPSTHSGTSTWILDTKAFHMSYDFSTLTFVRHVESHARVLTTDGNPHTIAN